MARLPTFKKKLETLYDWDVDIYLLRKIKGEYIPTKVASYAMFNETVVSMQKLANTFNKTNNYIFEFHRINETIQRTIT